MEKVRTWDSLAVGIGGLANRGSRAEAASGKFNSMSEAPIEGSIAGLFALRGLNVENQASEGKYFLSDFDNPACSTEVTGQGSTYTNRNLCGRTCVVII